MTIYDIGFKSISEASKAAGMERQNLWKMLNGKEDPTVRMCFRLAKAWNADIVTVLKLFYPSEMED